MNSLTYRGISRDHALILSRSPKVNMSGRARQPKPEDPKTSESEAEIGGKMSKELRPKCKQPLVQLTRAHPFDVFGLSNSNEESYNKPMTKFYTTQEVLKFF